MCLRRGQARQPAQRRLDAELDRAARYGHQLSIILVDIDHFKRLNDTHGHVAGDQMLHAVAEVLRASVRGVDIVGRYGGEEFLCILPEQTLAGAVHATQRMRTSVQHLQLQHSGTATGVITLSAGVATLDPDHARPAHKVLKEADDALYQAKLRGRNRVETVAVSRSEVPR